MVRGAHPVFSVGAWVIGLLLRRLIGSSVKPADRPQETARKPSLRRDTLYG